MKTENGSATEYVYNALNQLVSDSETTYEYDLNGNLIRVIGSAQSALYEYNSENKLVKATVQNGVLVTEESYAYDYEGNRTSKTTHRSDGVTEYVKYLNDNSSLTNVLAEIDSEGNAVAIYNVGADLVSQERSGKTSIYLYDGHGSVVGLANENGKVTDTYAYDAFGNLLKSTGSTKNHYCYCGEQFDPVTGLYYLRARYMNPSVGRFITMDSYEGSIDDPVSLHKYLYANANPVSNSDPSGYVTVNQVKQNVKIISVAIIIVSPTLYSATIEYKHNQQVMQQGMQIVKALRVLEPIITGGSIFSSIYGDQIVALSHELICGIENSVEVCNRLRDEAIAEFVQVVGKSLTKIIRKIDQDRTHKYWEVDFYRLPISKKMNPVIGKGITKARAIERLRQGKSVITMYWYDAENIAYTAGNGARPMHHPLYTVKGNDQIGQFGHYHVGTHINEAHSMYIIGA